MTEVQLDQVRRVVTGLKPAEVHHGDCIGADEEFHRIVLFETEATIQVHPPIDGAKRAFVEAGPRVEILYQYPNLVRNGHIVDESDLLIAAPKEMEEIVRSGTWSTVRKAKARGVPVQIVYPDGSMELRRSVRKGVV